MDYDRETGEITERPLLPAAPDQGARNLIFASPSCGNVFAALCEMQGAMSAPKRTKKARVQTKTGPGYEYTYAPLDEIINTIKTPMAAAGLAYRQFLAARDGQWVMRTVIGHKSGEWMAADYPIFWDQSRGMQGFASGVTYARRYGLMLAVGIAAEDDDDANVADGRPATIEPRRAPAAPTPLHAGPETTAPADPLRERARTLYNRLGQDIQNAMTHADLDAAGSTLRFSEVRDAILEVEEPDRANDLMEKMEQRMLLRRDALSDRRNLGEMG